MSHLDRGDLVQVLGFAQFFRVQLVLPFRLQGDESFLDKTVHVKRKRMWKRLRRGVMTSNSEGELWIN